MDNLIVELTKSRFKIIEMPEKLRGMDNFEACNNITIKSITCPQIDGRFVYLRGDDRNMDKEYAPINLSLTRNVADYENAFIELCAVYGVMFFNVATGRGNEKGVTLWTGL